MHALIPLPIDAALPAIAEALHGRPSLVLEAPPGAGKTTRVPPLLIGGGRVVVLEPRRVAARAAARRIAEEQGWTLGEQVGWHIRFEARYRPATRLVFATEGVLLRWLQRDPLLEGVGAVVLDEVHERSLHTDLALALLREVQAARPDLRLVVMSATLDAEPFQAFLGGPDRCALLRVPGRSHPVSVHYDPRPDPRPMDVRVASAVRRAQGNVLVFLPGAGEIARAIRACEGIGPMDLLPLHGGLSGDEQDRALAPSSRRKAVFATNIAETSLTLDGVTTVIDTGLERTLRHDPATGVDRLVLGRISAVSATQRAGRAGRTGPGEAHRLWTEGEQQTLVPAPTPEIRRVDLAQTVLELRAWGVRDPLAFGWFEAPPAEAIAAADRLLHRLGALAGASVTPLGATLLRLPLHPRIGRLLISAHAAGRASDGAALAALISEPDLLRRAPDTSAPSDLLLRLDALGQVEDARFDPSVAARLGVDARAARSVARVRDQLAGLARALGPEPATTPGDEPLLRAMLDGWADRVCRRRAPRSERARMVGGQGVALDRASVVRDAELFIAVTLGSATGTRAEATVRLASAVERSWLSEELPHLVFEETRLAFDEDRLAVAAARVTGFDDLVLAERPTPISRTDAPEVERLLSEAASRDLARALPLASADQLLARIAAVRTWRPALDLPAPDDLVRQHLPSLCAGRRSFAELAALDLVSALLALLTWEQRQALESLAPERLEVPSGSRVRLDWSAGDAPVLAVRLQEMFGCARHPTVGDGVPVVLHLLSPAMRPVQVTSDLPGFWRRTWPEVRKELRGRYPKHDWPEDPLAASPRSRPGRPR
ncbi:MAG: ATP-dependent helicase HrpB [Myxococcales bacterium]